jgi:hypothetical protein
MQPGISRAPTAALAASRSTRKQRRLARIGSKSPASMPQAPTPVPSMATAIPSFSPAPPWALPSTLAAWQPKVPRIMFTGVSKRCDTRSCGCRAKGNLPGSAHIGQVRAYQRNVQQGGRGLLTPASHFPSRWPSPCGPCLPQALPWPDDCKAPAEKLPSSR